LAPSEPVLEIAQNTNDLNILQANTRRNSQTPRSQPKHKMTRRLMLLASWLFGSWPFLRVSYRRA